MMNNNHTRKRKQRKYREFIVAMTGVTFRGEGISDNVIELVAHAHD
jgi:hypothetical protein